MMARRQIIAGNWKMNLDLDQSLKLAHDIQNQLAGDQVDVAIFPMFTWLTAVRDATSGSTIAVGAQNCFYEESGAFTGEISPRAVAEICSAVLIGHSERRSILGETDEIVGKKLRAALDHGLVAYLCVGENLAERDNDLAEEVVSRQLNAALETVQQSDIDNLVIAYEPVWAIGTGKAATTNDAGIMCKFIRACLAERFGDLGRSIRVLYGGSVKPENAADLLSQPDIDGGLVGGASLNAAQFTDIIRAATEAGNL